MPAVTVAEIMRCTVRDLGGTRAAAEYCDRVAAQNGADCATYRQAAERLRDLTKGVERAAAYRDREGW